MGDQGLLTDYTMIAGHQGDFLGRPATGHFTKGYVELNSPNAWFLVDLGPKRRFFPTHYSLMTDTQVSYRFRSWRLEATNAEDAITTAKMQSDTQTRIQKKKAIFGHQTGWWRDIPAEARD